MPVGPPSLGSVCLTDFSYGIQGAILSSDSATDDIHLRFEKDLVPSGNRDELIDQ